MAPILIKLNGESSMKLEKVHVVTKASAASDEEKALVAHMAKRVVFIFGGTPFMCKASERLNCSALLNLTDRKDIDEFYKDVLIELSAPKAKKEKAPKEEKKEEKPEAKKPAPKKAPAKKAAPKTKKEEK